jgi:hypothetical protein
MAGVGRETDGEEFLDRELNVFGGGWVRFRWRFDLVQEKRKMNEFWAFLGLAGMLPATHRNIAFPA